MRTISFKAPDYLARLLVKQSLVRGITKSELLRNALRHNLLHGKGWKNISCFDLVSDRAGCIKGGPRDLATNPKYMEGFGEDHVNRRQKKTAPALANRRGGVSKVGAMAPRIAVG
jgi:hypothetical protein